MQKFVFGEICKGIQNRNGLCMKTNTLKAIKELQKMEQKAMPFAFCFPFQKKREKTAKIYGLDMEIALKWNLGQIKEGFGMEGEKENYADFEFEDTNGPFHNGKENGQNLCD